MHWKNRPPRFARWYYYPGRPPASASRCHASCSYPHPPRQLLRGRRCRTSSTRQRASHPRGFAARPIPDADARLRACHAACLSSQTRTATRPAKPSGSSHAQPESVMQTVIPRAMKTPRCSRNLLRSQVPRQRPLRSRFATSTLRSCCARVRRRRTPCGTRTASTLDAGLCAGSS